MDGPQLIESLLRLKATMIDVATGGSRIDDVNDEFVTSYALVASALEQRAAENPLPYADLWEWYERWSSGDLPSYQSRRVFVGEIFNPLIRTIGSGRAVPFEATGWSRVDRNVGRLRSGLATAATEEEYQMVGLVCREALISLAQAVHMPERHPVLDGVEPSGTDARRRLEAFIQVELEGSANKEARQHGSALGLALKLQHDRAADFRDAALCAEATTAVVNLVAIVSGRRDPERGRTS